MSNADTRSVRRRVSSASSSIPPSRMTTTLVVLPLPLALAFPWEGLCETATLMNALAFSLSLTTLGVTTPAQVISVGTESLLSLGRDGNAGKASPKSVCTGPTVAAAGGLAPLALAVVPTRFGWWGGVAPPSESGSRALGIPDAAGARVSPRAGTEDDCSLVSATGVRTGASTD